MFKMFRPKGPNPGYPSWRVRFSPNTVSIWTDPDFFVFWGEFVRILSEICPVLIRSRLTASLDEPLHFIGHLHSFHIELTSLQTYLISRIQAGDRNPTLEGSIGIIDSSDPIPGNVFCPS